MISIVIPAHNEERVIGRLLSGLLNGAEPGELDVVVVCNGCDDATAATAAAHGPDVRVVETPDASKHLALRLGDGHARSFPRLYVDADVELGVRDVRALADALIAPVLAAGPERLVPLERSRLPVRMYYAVWQRLPVVRAGLFGRGVVALSEEGHTRVRDLPPLMSDDLALSLSFAPSERKVVSGATVVVHPPRTWRDLLRRRVRALTGTIQVGGTTGFGGTIGAEGTIGAGGGMPGASARTSRGDLVGILRAEPWLAPAMAVFLAVTAIARRRSGRAVRSADYTTWLRDESSRA